MENVHRLSESKLERAYRLVSKNPSAVTERERDERTQLLATIANQLAKARDALGMQNLEFSELLGVAINKSFPAYLRSTGKVLSRDDLDRFAAALGVTVDWLISGEPYLLGEAGEVLDRIDAGWPRWTPLQRRAVKNAVEGRTV